MPNTSGFSPVSFRWLFQADDIVPITGLECFAEIRTGSLPSRGNEPAKHRLRYRSVTGRRLAVMAESKISGGEYIEPSARADSTSSDRTSWMHDGATEVGSYVKWAKAFASYESTSGMPGVAVAATVWADSPLDRPMNAAGFFALE